MAFPAAASWPLAVGLVRLQPAATRVSRSGQTRLRCSSVRRMSGHEFFKFQTATERTLRTIRRGIYQVFTDLAAILTEIIKQRHAYPPKI
jgi:hypothetical protein